MARDPRRADRVARRHVHRFGDLDRARGRWQSIAKDTGINYFTICRIARGNTPDPGVKTYERLRQWCDKNLSRDPEAA